VSRDDGGSIAVSPRVDTVAGFAIGSARRANLWSAAGKLMPSSFLRARTKRDLASRNGVEQVTIVASEPTIERKEYSDQRAKTVMLEALRGRNARLTRADAIVASGLPEDEAGRALTVLLKEYRSHLSATESGELLYEFDPTFQRRNAVSWRERAAAVGRKLWTGFRFLFKVAIVATLVGYFAAFVAMMVAMIFARSGSNDRDDDGGFGLGGLF